MSKAPTSRFWDRTAERYARKPVADEAAYRKKQEITRQYLRPDMEILEFGCGTGSTALLHAPRVNHILAIDISARMLEIAREKAAAAEIGNVTFKQASIGDFTANGECFDAVLGLSILHLVEDWNAAIVKTHAMLKPGGIFVSSTPCLGDVSAVLRTALRPVLPAGRILGFFPLVRFFTAQQLADSLTAAGFVIDHQWRPGHNAAVFIVARKAE